MSAEVVPLLERLGPGAAVACNLRCPNYLCRKKPLVPGSAEVVNAYGVRDLIPARCGRCNVLLEIAEFVDLEAAHEQASHE